MSPKISISDSVLRFDFRVDPDPSKAVNLCVTFDSKAPCVVGELLPGKRSRDAKSLAWFRWLTFGNPRKLFGTRRRNLGQNSYWRKFTKRALSTSATRFEKVVKSMLNYLSRSARSLDIILSPLLLSAALSAHVLGEDDAVMKPSSSRDIVLKIWHSKDGPVSDKPPARVAILKALK